MPSVLNFSLTDRELKEVEFARLYVSGFNHGTPGHNHYVLIAKLADIVNNMEIRLDESIKPDPPGPADSELG
jgi:hypothetical protein